ncbi:hypothetical protein [Sphingopyxis sp. SCN 67-31]|uniref:hypothetical protein n=1 Tax=Sphingopyxis sp. SCN 67-31 TaxID=1660142 RepID=UPI002579FA96|nr:hypothetical protein [Sphingopyxis sp. SCN 67-31]
MMLIDPPSVFSPVAEWQSFLHDMEAIETDDQADMASIAEYIEMAKGQVARLSRPSD